MSGAGHHRDPPERILAFTQKRNQERVRVRGEQVYLGRCTRHRQKAVHLRSLERCQGLGLEVFTDSVISQSNEWWDILAISG